MCQNRHQEYDKALIVLITITDTEMLINNSNQVPVQFNSIKWPTTNLLTWTHQVYIYTQSISSWRTAGWLNTFCATSNRKTTQMKMGRKDAISEIQQTPMQVHPWQIGLLAARSMPALSSQLPNLLGWCYWRNGGSPEKTRLLRGPSFIFPAVRCIHLGSRQQNRK